MKRLTPSYIGASDHRDLLIANRGVTLIEVLMSLMIMALGVSAVMVLFPISVLRSVQATHLTNAAILQANAVTLINARKQLIFDPDGDGNMQEHIGRQNELNYMNIISRLL